MTLLEEVAELLEELGLGRYAADGDVFLVVMPDSPDAAVVLSRQAGRESDARLGYDEPVVRIRVRGAPANATAPEARGQAIYDAVHGLASRRLPGGTWLVSSIGTQAGPVYIGRDANGRDEWEVIVRMELARAGGNRP
jgi:hypothetical protein